MKLWIKLGGTALMACTAAVCAWAALGGITGQAPERENTAAAYSYVPSCSLAEAEYVLREYDGCVAVFASVGDTSPITLTDIEVGTLRTRTGRYSARPGRSGPRGTADPAGRPRHLRTVFHPRRRKIRLIYCGV